MVRIKGHSDLGDFDREDTNRSDGQHFYGHDGHDGIDVKLLTDGHVPQN
jgi:hypothetical protein